MLKGKSIIEQTTNLYRGLGFKSIFAKIRLWDAPYVEIEKLVPKEGIVVEVGCGEGLFSNFLGLSSSKRKIVGIDIDRNRLKDANRGLVNVNFRYGNAVMSPLPTCDAFVLVHVLHHLKSPRDQEKVIKECISKLRHNGKIIIVEIEPKISIKFALTWFTDHFIVPILFEKKLFEPHINFRKKQEWVSILVGYGMRCKSVEAEKGKPFSHVIISAVKH